MKKSEYNLLTGKVIGAAIEVHKELGPGLLESVYEHCLLAELRNGGIHIAHQVAVPIMYKGEQLNKTFFMDLLVEDHLVVELKCVEILLPVHEVQLLTYLKLSEKKLGLLINFNVPKLSDGIRRIINGYL